MRQVENQRRPASIFSPQLFWLLQQIFFPLNEKTSFRINQKFREFTRNINKESKIVTTKGRNFFINNFYSGIARFKFKDLCDNNLGAEDYINISNHIFSLILLQKR